MEWSSEQDMSHNREGEGRGGEGRRRQDNIFFL